MPRPLLSGLPLILGLILTLSLSAQAKPLAKGPSAAVLRARLEALVLAAGGNRTAGSAGNKRAYDWLLAQARTLKGWEVQEYPFTPDVDFALAGYRSQFEPFSSLPPKAVDFIRGKRSLDSLSGFAESLRGKPLLNLILRKRGTSAKRKGAKELLVVSAHFDTMTNRREPFEVFPKGPAPGADNNGAAVVALLALAESLSDFKPAATLELIFTNAGEAYFLGARAYAQDCLAKGLSVRHIELNMIGWDANEKDRVHLYVRSEGRPGFESDKALALQIAPELFKTGLKPGIVRENSERGDHWAFWRSFHASTMISQDWEHGFNDLHYRTAGDVPGTVDWEFVSKIEKGVELGVRKILK